MPSDTNKAPGAPVWEPTGCALAYGPQPYAPMLYAASERTSGRGMAARSDVIAAVNWPSVLHDGTLFGREHDTLQRTAP